MVPTTQEGDCVIVCDAGGGTVVCLNSYFTQSEPDDNVRSLGPHHIPNQSI